ncbi:hypothetical protein CPB83DRAFT_851060 [Crepidotus variabilis]|uniref:Uncharacterized protein n=1 Tax=Crepidotus variabilis TaxID=179855 RepID=A0A9P6EJE7_9AGAR|nr:hypothetical protein CPB83DRAFT_851060 [Crepidotus variabilis]
MVSFAKAFSETFPSFLRRFLSLLWSHQQNQFHNSWFFQFLRRLTSAPRFYMRLFFGKGRKTRDIGTGPDSRSQPQSSGDCTEPGIRTIEGDLQSQSHRDTAHFSIVDHGEIISLDEVAFSQVYVLSDSGLHNASRASSIQIASTANHERQLQSRQATPAPSVYSGALRKEDETSSLGSIPGRASPHQHLPIGNTHTFPPLPSPLVEQNESLDNSTNRLLLPSSPSSYHPGTPSTSIDHIIAIIPEATSAKRYGDRPITKKCLQEVMVQAFDVKLNSPPPPNGWVRHAHPEGARYFSRKLGDGYVFTDSDLPDPRILGQINQDADAILQAYLRDSEARGRPTDWNLVVSCCYDSASRHDIESFYYFVDHESRKLFFLQDFLGSSLGDIWKEAQGCNSLQHLAYELEAQYWLFVSLFPTSRLLSRKLIQELRDITLYCIGDSVFSPSALAPFSTETLEKILSWTKAMDSNDDSSSDEVSDVKQGFLAPGSLSLLARLMFGYYHDWFVHFHGEGHARLERHKSVYGLSTNRRTWLVTVVSPFLFSSPDVQLKHLQKLWVDGVMHKTIWENSVKKLNEEWQEHVLFGTVMLNANMGFLAIGTVDGNREKYRSPSQIASYLSIVASIGSILLALLLLRQNRTKIKETANDVQAFMDDRNHRSRGLEMLAILYSLPYALLMWSVVSFLIAFAIHCFRSTTTATQGIIGSFSGVSAIFILWCIVQAWEQKEEDNGIVSEADATDQIDQFGSIPLVERRPAAPVGSVISEGGSQGTGNSDKAQVGIFVNVRKPTGDLAV